MTMSDFHKSSAFPPSLFHSHTVRSSRLRINHVNMCNQFVPDTRQA